MRISSLGALVATICTLAIGLAGCGGTTDVEGSGDGGELNEVVVASQAQQSYVQMHLSEELGYFEDAGIALDKVEMNRGAGPIMAALSNGSVNVTIQGPAVMASANEEGGDLRFFCGTGSRANGVMLAPSGSDIAPATADTWKESVQAWKGKAIGIPALEGAVALTIKALISSSGLSLDQLELVPVGIGDSSFQALKQGEIDVLFSVPFYTQQWTDESEVVFDWAADAPESQSRVMQGGWMASKRWLDENPELAVGFCESMGKGIEATSTEPEATRKVLSEKFGLSDGALDAAMATDGPLSLQSTNLDCAAATAAMTSAYEAGLVKNEHTCEDIFWKADK